MSKNVLVVIDMQNDFIDGALGTKEAQAIIENVYQVIQSFEGEVVFTRDTHFENYADTQEGKKLPIPHCIKGTNGWQINSKLKNLIKPETKIFDKIPFGSTELTEYLKNNKELEKVTLAGLCTDICIISNALLIKANLPEVEIEVLENCCAGVTPESHINALNAMKMFQISVK